MTKAKEQIAQDPQKQTANPFFRQFPLPVTKATFILTSLSALNGQYLGQKQPAELNLRFTVL
jgi:hypothetical protein